MSYRRERDTERDRERDGLRSFCVCRAGGFDRAGPSVWQSSETRDAEGEKPGMKGESRKTGTDFEMIISCGKENSKIPFSISSFPARCQALIQMQDLSSATSVVSCYDSTQPTIR